MTKIVVGIDGSENSKRALRWAIGEAELHGAELVAVHAWMYPLMAGNFEAIMPSLSDLDLEGAAAKELDQAVRAVVGEAPVKVRQEVKRGPAAGVLVEASRDADMLVVGSRGLGGFRGLLLGSVGQQCAHHAACPVVIIPRAD